MWKRAVCNKDCPDTCGLLVKTDNSRVTAVKGDPDHPFTNGFICKKAAGFPEQVHSPHRILTPLKRTGKKGSADFSPISWEEALDEIANRIRSVCDEYGPQAILPYSYAGHMGLVQRNAGHAFFHRLGASRLDYTICGPASTAGFQMSLGRGPSTEIEWSAHSDLIIIWGSNTLTTNLHAWPFFQQARKAGATVVVIDPYRNRTARKADLHLKIKPGTDAALALGIMHVLIKEDLIDHGFIKEKTTGFEQLKERVEHYPPEVAAAISGVSKDEIIDLALQYGRALAPYIRTGWGPGRQLKGGMAMRAISLLPGLVGAFDKKGGGITRSTGSGFKDISPFTRPDLCPPETRFVNMVELGNALTKLDDPPVKLLYNYLSNPAVVAPQSKEVLKGLARPDLFVVVQEMFLTDTARFADIILPGAGFLEVTDLYQSFGHNYFQMARPIIDPVGESRPILSTFQALAGRMGFDEPVFSMDEDQIIRLILEKNANRIPGSAPEQAMAGLTLRFDIPANPYEKGFNTPSGKVEFFSQTMADKGLDPLPDGEPLRDPGESGDGGTDNYPFELITPPHHMLLNSSFNELAQFKDETGVASIKIHPEAASNKQIQTGDPVRVFNDRGECLLTAEVTNDVQPDLLVAEGLHWPSLKPGSGINQLTSQRLTDMGETCAFHCNRVAIEKVAE